MSATCLMETSGRSRCSCACSILRRMKKSTGPHPSSLPNTALSRLTLRLAASAISRFLIIVYRWELMNSIARRTGTEYACDAMLALSSMRMPDFSTLPAPTNVGIVANFNLDDADVTTNFAFRFSGFIEIPANGSYTFFMTADDEASFFIDGAQAMHGCDWCGPETNVTRTFSAGMHPIALEYYLGGRPGGSLSVSWQPSGGVKQAIPDSLLWWSIPPDGVTATTVSGMEQRPGHFMVSRLGANLLRIHIPDRGRYVFNIFSPAGQRIVSARGMGPRLETRSISGVAQGVYIVELKQDGRRSVCKVATRH